MDPHGARQALRGPEAPLLAVGALLLIGSSSLAGCGGKGHEEDDDAGAWVGDSRSIDGGFSSSPTHRYRLARSADSVLAPSPDPKSFAFDGYDYWFFYGAETKSGGRVVEIDPVTSVILRDWSVPPLLVDSP